MFSARLREAVTRSEYSVREISERTGISQRTINNWLKKEAPAMPRADEAVQLASLLGTSVEAWVTGKDQSLQENSFTDIIQDLNVLPEFRLDDVRRLIQPWANEVRGAAQQIVDIVVDLKVLPKDRLEDLRRLVHPWAEEARSIQDESRGGAARAG